MNKKLMAVAVAGALAAPAVAFAQASNVQLYGRANLGVDVYSATGATAGSAGDWKSRTRVFDNGSRFGLRGQENLGGGLKAIFLMENGVAMDSGNGNGQNGATNTSVGLAARIGYVGLAGGWGQLTFGRQNVFWTNGQFEQWQANYGSVGNQFFTGGMGNGMGVGVARQSNTVQYASPVMGGVMVELSYSPDAQETAAAGANNANGRLYNITLRGDHGKFMWGWDHADTTKNTPNTGSQAKGIGDKAKVGFKYLPGAQVSLFYVKSKKDNQGLVDPTSTSVNQSGWGVVWEHTFGNFAVEANYSKLSDVKGCNASSACNSTNGKAAFIGARYLLSKRTHLLAFYLKLDNAANYNADVPAGGMSSVSGTLAAGADPKVYGVGIVHNF